jgi:hypothetical protein
MRRTIDSSASAVPLAPMLLMTSIDAHRDVTEGIREFNDAFRLATGRKVWLSMALRVAVQQLHRTYLTLVWEAQRVCTLTPAKLGGAIEALQRRNLVPRVHKGRGDFGVVDRACNLLQAHGESDDQLAAVAAIPRRWTNRELHFFGMLVPLAGYTEELARELQSLQSSSNDAQTVAARLEAARREMEPVLRLFCLTAQALKRFMDELTHPRR